MNVMITKK